MDPRTARVEWWWLVRARSPCGTEASRIVFSWLSGPPDSKPWWFSVVVRPWRENQNGFAWFRRGGNPPRPSKPGELAPGVRYQIGSVIRALGIFGDFPAGSENQNGFVDLQLIRDWEPPWSRFRLQGQREPMWSRFRLQSHRKGRGNFRL